VIGVDIEACIANSNQVEKIISLRIISTMRELHFDALAVFYLELLF
jgi:hypothetical protein